MSKKWALPVPLHIAADDYSPEACELRLHLYQNTYTRVRGKGFRQTQTTRLGSRVRPFNRVEAMWITQKYGERNAK